MVKNRKNNGMEEIGSVTPTPILIGGSSSKCISLDVEMCHHLHFAYFQIGKFWHFATYGPKSLWWECYSWFLIIVFITAISYVA